MVHPKLRTWGAESRLALTAVRWDVLAGCAALKSCLERSGWLGQWLVNAVANLLAQVQVACLAHRVLHHREMWVP